MPSRKTTKAAETMAARMPRIPKDLIDQFVTGPMTGKAVNDLCMAFKKALIERALGAELEGGPFRCCCLDGDGGLGGNAAA